ncbi:MAG: hypothetical protein ACK55I_30315, partial [bacterium]
RPEGAVGGRCQGGVPRPVHREGGVGRHVLRRERRHPVRVPESGVLLDARPGVGRRVADWGRRPRGRRVRGAA